MTQEPQDSDLTTPKALDEHRSKALLATYGIPVVQEQIAADPAQALQAAEAIGYPVVLKALGSRHRRLVSPQGHRPCGRHGSPTSG